MYTQGKLICSLEYCKTEIKFMYKYYQKEDKKESKLFQRIREKKLLNSVKSK